MVLSDILSLLVLSLFVNFGNGITDGEGVIDILFSTAYIASLRSIADRTKHICSGAIYDHHQWIITARSCLLSPVTERVQRMVVHPFYAPKLSVINQYSPYEMRKSFCHPFLKNKPDILTDIGLIKLRTPISSDETMGLEKARSLREDFNFEKYYYTFSNIDVRGWGKIKETDRELPDFLRIATFQLRSPKECYNDPKSFDFVHPNHICIRYAPDPRVTTCFGDDGGPVKFSVAYPTYRELIGIIPSTSGNCSWSPFIMNTSHFREFIDDVVRHEPPEYECINLMRPT